MTHPYSIPLLNELHEHFPDILYQPTRFRNVGDLLNYIIGVAQQNPYTTARDEYYRLRRSAPATTVSSRSIPIQPVPQHHVPQHHAPQSSLPDLSMNRIVYGLFDAQHEISLERPAVFPMRPNRRAAASAAASDPIMSFIGDLLGGSGGLQSFLDQPVVVRPTTDQIDTHTILIRAFQQQDDNCAICQDPIEVNQMMRIISHCTHRFHQNCIDTWFESHVTCPTCRHDIRESSDPLS